MSQSTESVETPADAYPPSAVVTLWKGSAPGALGTDAETDVPTLSVYRPSAERATGAAMVIAPGGGYGMLAPHEGRDFALFLAQLGVACFVLKYRLGPRYRHPVMLQDAQRAIRLVRHHASEWKIDCTRVGMMGSSAGGHLTSTAMTHFDAGDANAADPIDRHSSRPDVGVLCYPVISTGGYTHPGSMKNLLGENPSADLLKRVSSELQVTPQTPPCFMWHTVEDQAVDVRHPLEFAASLARNKVLFDLHIYEKGRHGLGLGVEKYDPSAGQALLPWTADLTRWLKTYRFA